MPIAFVSPMPSPKSSSLILSCTAVLVITSLASAQQFKLLRKDHGQRDARPEIGSGIAADVDSNGTIDILLRSGSLLRNDGQLGFSWEPPGTSIPLDPNQQIATRFYSAADVNGDGLLDLVVGSISFLPAQAHISVLSGTAAGTWGPAQPAGSTPGLGTMRGLLDIDGDTHPDIFIGTGTTFVLMRNTGNGTFVDVSATHLPPNPSSSPIAFADVDGDGDQDFVTASNGIALEVLTNDGSGHFSVLAGSGLPAFFIAPAAQFGDADGDGDQDLMIFPGGGVAAQLMLNSGQGTFVNSGTTLPAARNGRLFEDIDGDGDADLLVASLTEWTTWENQAGQFVAIQSLPLESFTLLGDPVLVDLDADTDLDVVIGGALMFVNDGTQNYSPLQRDAVGPTQQGGSVVAGDLDGDGNVDLLLGNHTMRNEGDGFFTEAAQILPSESGARVLFDADADGDLDIAWSTRDNSPTSQTIGGVSINQGGMLFLTSLLTNNLLIGDIEAADFNNDGLVDLCSGAGIILQNTGGGNFTAIAGAPLGNGPLVTADFDNDGLIDIAIGDSAGWLQWRNIGNMQFQQVATNPLSQLTCMAAGDIDNDGDIDLVTGTYLPPPSGPQGNLLVWTNDQGVLTSSTFYATGSTSPRGVVIADVDEDGANDMIGDRVWTNDGTGAFSDLMRGAHGVGEVAVADLDRDGDVEVIYGDTFLSAVFVNRHRHLGSPRFAVLTQPYRIEMAVRPGYGGSHFVAPWLAAARIPATPLPSLGLLHIDPATAVPGGIGITDANGEYSLAIQVPNIPALVGTDLFWQGIIAEVAGLRLTSCVNDIVLR